MYQSGTGCLCFPPGSALPCLPALLGDSKEDTKLFQAESRVLRDRVLGRGCNRLFEHELRTEISCAVQTDWLCVSWRVLLRSALKLSAVE